MKFLAHIYVTPKQGVNNPEVLAIKRWLENLGYKNIAKVNSGKYIQIELSEGLSEAEANARIKEMCNRMLANIVIEQYRFDLEKID